MKKLIASAGLVALGASGIQAALPSQVPSDKPWNISATLRGFYDDNYTLAPDDGDQRESFGFELNPKVKAAISLGQTEMGASYAYSMRWFEDRPDHKSDQSHQFDAWLTHNFTERYSVDVSDSFVVAQEPTLVDPDNSAVTARDKADAIRNNGQINFHADLTREFSLLLGYANTLYDYKDSGERELFGFFLAPSRSGLLDRMEHVATVNAIWRIAHQTRTFLGYEFGLVNYTADEQISVLPSDGSPIFSDDRDNRSHKVYVGVDHNFRSDLSGSARVGAKYTDYFNSPNEQSDWSPFVDANVRYTYLAGSSLVVGVRHDRNQTDIVSPQNDEVVQDQQSTVGYASLTHQITPRLTGNVLGQAQRSEFNGGSVDGDADIFYLVGLNLAYRFNRYFAGEVGYNYDKLDSDISGRSYDRNRVYIGVTASY